METAGNKLGRVDVRDEGLGVDVEAAERVAEAGVSDDRGLAALILLFPRIRGSVSRWLHWRARGAETVRLERKYYIYIYF